MFYTMQEAVKKTGLTEDQIRQYAREGRLREFRDGPRTMWKADQIEELSSHLKSGVSGVSGFCYEAMNQMRPTADELEAEVKKDVAEFKRPETAEDLADQLKDAVEDVNILCDRLRRMGYYVKCDVDLDEDFSIEVYKKIT